MLHWPKLSELHPLAPFPRLPFPRRHVSKSLCAVLLLALTCAAPALRAGDKGAPYFRHGQQSMEAKNYDQAYVDFQKAMELSPDNVEYQIATQRAQFAAANEHIRKGEQYKASKNY